MITLKLAIIGNSHKEYLIWAKLLLKAIEAAGINQENTKELILNDSNVNVYLEWYGQDLFSGDKVKIIIPAWYQDSTRMALVLDNGTVKCFGEWSKKIQHKRSLEDLSNVMQLVRQYVSYVENIITEESFFDVYKSGRLLRIDQNGTVHESTLLNCKKYLGMISKFGIHTRLYMCEDKKNNQQSIFK